MVLLFVWWWWCKGATTKVSPWIGFAVDLSGDIYKQAGYSWWECFRFQRSPLGSQRKGPTRITLLPESGLVKFVSKQESPGASGVTYVEVAVSVLGVGVLTTNRYNFAAVTEECFGFWVY